MSKHRHGPGDSRRCRNRGRLAASGHRPLALRDGNDLQRLPPLPQRSRCSSGKLRYPAGADAELVLAGLDSSNPRRREQRTYECPICAGWHLTSQPPHHTTAR